MVYTVLGLFETAVEAQSVVTGLIDEGVPRENISVVIPNEQTSKPHDDHTARRVATGLGTGAAAGGALGLLAGIGAFAIPGIGPILAAGPVIAALEGAGFGAIVGGLAGTISDIGVPDEKLEAYAESLKSGSSLVLVRTEEENVDRVHKLLEAHGALESAERPEPEMSESDLVETDSLESDRLRAEKHRPIPPVP